ncbi:uncharacterized protein J3D65DRAFT_608567 [Phyllosticta citribraziliensis]|uniref:Biogenesis of lysosome-related organelles complex 1 subunit 1 n=1 Tax=Phyllosticta citribraziliensis TaxID=989973 RepID=A0ABR1MA41_9PEZI
MSSQSTPQAKQTENEQRIAEARAAVTASLSSVGGSMDTKVRTRAADIHANAATIEKQEKELAKQTAALAKETAKWEKLAHQNVKKLNEMGDLQNWAEMIEHDLLVVEETLRLAEGRAEAGNASGTSEWTHGQRAQRDEEIPVGGLQETE